MRKKFKKMTLAEKKVYIKQKEFEMQKFEYERQIQVLKRGQEKTKHYDTDSSLDEKAARVEDKKTNAYSSIRPSVSQRAGSQTHRHLQSLNVKGTDSVFASNIENLK